MQALEGTSAVKRRRAFCHADLPTSATSRSIGSGHSETWVTGPGTRRSARPDLALVLAANWQGRG